MRVRIHYGTGIYTDTTIENLDHLISAWRQSKDRIYILIGVESGRKDYLNLDKIILIEERESADSPTV